MNAEGARPVVWHFHIDGDQISKALKDLEKLIKKKTRRPRSTISFDDRHILRKSHSNPRLTMLDIAKKILIPEESNPSVRTICRRLRAAGLYGRRLVKKPFISAKNRKAPSRIPKYTSIGYLSNDLMLFRVTKVSLCYLVATV